MFTIDLLKGQGIPVKSRPETIAIAAVAFAVPVIIAIVILGYYLHSGIILSIQKQGVVIYETRIANLLLQRGNTLDCSPPNVVCLPDFPY